MRNIFIYLLFFLLLTSFSNEKEIADRGYLQEIPFNFDYGLPIIKATINDKEYNFLFDTGMPTALSQHISDELQFKNTRSSIGMDVNHNKQKESYVLVDEIKVGGISFKNIETLTADFKAVFEIGCLHIDGVIGNNIIKDAVWEIDYEKQIIRLTEDIIKLNIPKHADIIKFKTYPKRGYYHPYIEVSVNKKKSKGVLFDTGSTGGIYLSLNFYSKVLDPTTSVASFGKTSAALYGTGKDRSYLDSKVKTLKIGTLKLQDQLISFTETSSIIGNGFFKNYKIIIDYEDHKIYMIQQQKEENKTLENFGFQVSIMEGKAIVVIIYKGSDAEQKGLQLGDEIIAVNELQFSELIAKNACDVLFNNPIKEMDSIHILFSRNGNKQSMQLEKATLIH